VKLSEAVDWVAEGILSVAINATSPSGSSWEPDLATINFRKLVVAVVIVLWKFDYVRRPGDPV